MVAKKKTSVKKKVAAKKKTVTKKRASPVRLTPSLADKICHRLSEGESVRHICSDPKMPAKSAVMSWLADEKYGWFKDRYTRAREEGLELMAAEILEISDGDQYSQELNDLRRELIDCIDPKEQFVLECKIHNAAAAQKELANRDKLRVDARKWLLSKMLPRKYGDKLDLNHGGQPGNPVETVKRVIIDAKNTDD